MKTIIFDLDGTLLDTLQDLYNSTNYALQQTNNPTRSIEEVRQFVGNGIAKLIERALPADSSKQQVEECLNIFKQHYSQHCLDNTQPYDGIMKMLEDLKDNGIKMAIVSNKVQSAVTELNERFFNNLIDVAIGETPQLQRKPQPDMLLEAMHQLGTTLQDTTYVGDSDTDILTAHNAGVECISVIWGFRDENFLLQSGAKHVVSTPAEILGIISTNNK